MIKKIIFGVFFFFSPFALANDRYYSLQELTVVDGILYDNMGELVDGLVTLKIMPQYDFFVPYQNGIVSDGSMSITDKMGNVVSELVLKDKEVVSGFNIREGIEQPIPEQDKQRTTSTVQKLFNAIPHIIEKYDDILSEEQNEEEQSPLYHAADIGDLDEVKKLVKAGADVNYVCNVKCQGWTPVMIAAANGHAQVVHYLLEAGANPNAKNRFGRSALSFVAKYNYGAIAKDLLDHGADPNLKSINDVADTPVKVALTEGHTDMLILLLKYGGDKNAIVDGKSIMDLANEKNAIELMKMLK